MAIIFNSPSKINIFPSKLNFEPFSKLSFKSSVSSEISLNKSLLTAIFDNFNILILFILESQELVLQLHCLKMYHQEIKDCCF